MLPSRSSRKPWPICGDRNQRAQRRALGAGTVRERELDERVSHLEQQLADDEARDELAIAAGQDAKSHKEWSKLDKELRKLTDK